MDNIVSFKVIAAAIVYSFVGIGILMASFVAIDKLTPDNLWKQIVDEKNIALAVLIGAMILAISQIISTTLHR